MVICGFSRCGFHIDLFFITIAEACYWIDGWLLRNTGSFSAISSRLCLHFADLQPCAQPQKYTCTVWWHTHFRPNLMGFLQRLASTLPKETISPLLCVFLSLCVSVCVRTALAIFPCLFALSEAHGVRDEQGVCGLSQTVSSGWLPSTSAGLRIRCSMCGELLVRPSLSVPQEVLSQWLWADLPSPS